MKKYNVRQQLNCLGDMYFSRISPVRVSISKFHEVYEWSCIVHHNNIQVRDCRHSILYQIFCSQIVELNAIYAIF